MTHPHAKPLYALGDLQATRLDPRGMVVHNTADPERWPQGEGGGVSWGTTYYAKVLTAFGFEVYAVDKDWRRVGAWVHVGRRCVVTYERGEVTEIQCGSRANLIVTLKDLADRFGPAPLDAKRPGDDLLTEEADDARAN